MFAGGAAAHRRYNKTSSGSNSASTKRRRQERRYDSKSSTKSRAFDKKDDNNNNESAAVNGNSRPLPLLPTSLGDLFSALGTNGGRKQLASGLKCLLLSPSNSDSPRIPQLKRTTAPPTPDVAPSTSSGSTFLMPPTPAYQQRKRAGSMPALRFTLGVAWNLRAEHVRALKVTWSRLCDTPRSNCRGIIAIMERVFEKFESKEKTLKDVFYRSAFVDSMAECAQHCRMLRIRPSTPPTHYYRFNNGRNNASPPPYSCRGRRNGSWQSKGNAAADAVDQNPLSPSRRYSDTMATAVVVSRKTQSSAKPEAVANPSGRESSIATLHDHIHFFVSLISQVIQSLEKEPQQIFEHIDKIGCYHTYLKRYGFRATMWDQLGVCLIDGLVVQDCVRGFPEACRAWTIMVAALIDRLRSAPRNLFISGANNSSTSFGRPPPPAPTVTIALPCRQQQSARAGSTSTLCVPNSPIVQNEVVGRSGFPMVRRSSCRLR